MRKVIARIGRVAFDQNMTERGKYLIMRDPNGKNKLQIMTKNDKTEENVQQRYMGFSRYVEQDALFLMLQDCHSSLV